MFRVAKWYWCGCSADNFNISVKLYLYQGMSFFLTTVEINHKLSQTITFISVNKSNSNFSNEIRPAENFARTMGHPNNNNDNFAFEYNETG